MKLDEKLKNVKKLAICGHVRPDGDCVGSCLGLYNYIVENFREIEVHVYLEKNEGFTYLANIDKVEDQISDENFDLFISLDTSTMDRIGVISEEFKAAENTLCIDHHVSNTGFAKENYIISDASSCCEVLYGILDEELISKNVAEALYTGIVHDTGVFKYQSTTEETMRIAGKLLSKGIDQTMIIDESFYSKSYKQNLVLGRALLESVRVLDGKCIFSVTSKETMAFYDIEPFELGGIVEQLRLTDGVECAIYMYEIGSLEYKVSLRSKNTVDVNAIATYYGGGGHVRAAGFNMKGTTYDVVNNVIREVAKQLL